MAGGGAAPQPKQDEHQPHPVKDQLPNVSYCITSPPPWRKFNASLEPSFAFFFLVGVNRLLLIWFELSRFNEDKVLSSASFFYSVKETSVKLLKSYKLGSFFVFC